MSKEFLEWHKEFVEQCAKGGYSYGESKPSPKWCPKDMQEWLDLIDKNHEKLREKIGGISKTTFIDPSKNDEDEVVAPYQSVYDIMYYINYYMPGYYEKYGLTHEDFQHQKLKKLKNIGATKHILGYAKRAKVDEGKLAEVEKYVERLGQLFKKAKARKVKGYITMTTEPKAFCLLGQFGFDGGCFAQGSFNSDKKYGLGVTENSFVLLIHSEPEYELKKREYSYSEKGKNVVGRALGVITGDDLGMVHTVNHSPSIYAYDDRCGSLADLTAWAKDYLEAKEISTQNNKVTLTHGINYGSNSGYTFFDPKKHEPLKNTLYVRIDPRYVKEAHPNGDSFGKVD
jgi:hypothetical protein